MHHKMLYYSQSFAVFIERESMTPYDHLASEPLAEMTRNARLGEIIKSARKKKGLTQLELAGELGINEKTLRNYESGETVLDNISLLRNIAEILSIEPEQLGLATHTSYT